MVLYNKDTFTIFTRTANHKTQEIKSVDIIQVLHERPYPVDPVMTDEDSLLIKNLWLL